MNVLPAAVSVPLRPLLDPLADTEYVTVPFPLPLVPDVIVIQLEPLLALHAHPPGALTLMLPLPPLDVLDALVGDIV